MTIRLFASRRALPAAVLDARVATMAGPVARSRLGATLASVGLAIGAALVPVALAGALLLATPARAADPVPAEPRAAGQAGPRAPIDARAPVLAQAQAPTPPAPASAGAGPVHYRILTASPRGTYIEIGRDLARYVAPAAGIDLDALTSAGAIENVRRLRTEPDVKFALVQSDVYQAFLDLAANGNQEARQLIQPLRVVMPLYNEEIYFVVRQDSPLRYIHEIEGQRISAGPLGSGSALTTATLFRRLFGRGLGEDQARYQSNEQALASLVTDRAVDVVAIVAGQPTKVLADMRPEARDLVRLLRFDPNHPTSQAVLETYFPATVAAANYPNLLDEDVPALAVKAYLVTYNYQQPHTIEMLGRFGRALCANFATLQRDGHPKWREVRLEQPPLSRGWRYFPATERVLKRCPPPVPAAPAVEPGRKGGAPGPRCASEEQRTLGLCPDAK